MTFGAARTAEYSASFHISLLTFEKSRSKFKVKAARLIQSFSHNSWACFDISSCTKFAIPTDIGLPEVILAWNRIFVKIQGGGSAEVCALPLSKYFLQGGSKENTPADNMQYLRNQWTDFKNSCSCLILTIIVWIQRYTMYPLHLNYATTLPRKTITIKITNFHTGIFVVTPE